MNFSPATFALSAVSCIFYYDDSQNFLYNPLELKLVGCMSRGAFKESSQCLCAPVCVSVNHGLFALKVKLPKHLAVSGPSELNVLFNAARGFFFFFSNKAL